MRTRIEGADALRRALAAGAPVRLVLTPSEDVLSTLDDAVRRDVASAVEGALAHGVAVRRVTAAVLRRFSAGAPAPLLALAGPPVDDDVDGLMARRGPVWLLAGVAYPGNAGFAIRTAEVSGAAGIVLDAVFSARQRKAALRASMQAHHLFPVLWEPAGRAIEAARAAGRRVVALEDAGGVAPSDAGLGALDLLVVGGEGNGVPPSVLDAADVRVRVPMAGFIPSYNLQAAMAAVAARLAETHASGGPEAAHPA